MVRVMMKSFVILQYTFMLERMCVALSVPLARQRSVISSVGASTFRYQFRWRVNVALSVPLARQRSVISSVGALNVCISGPMLYIIWLSCQARIAWDTLNTVGHVVRPAHCVTFTFYFGAFAIYLKSTSDGFYFGAKITWPGIASAKGCRRFHHKRHAIFILITNPFLFLSNFTK